MTNVKIKIPTNCMDCQFAYESWKTRLLRCALFNVEIEDHVGYAKCPQCLAKPEIEIEWEE